MELLRSAGTFASLRDYDQARRARRRSAGAADAADRRRRVQRAADREARLPRPVHHHRPGRPVARRASAARLPAAGGGSAARAWTPTCRTGSGSRPSRWPNPGSCWARRTRSSCPPRPATATSSSTPPAWSGSRAPTCPDRSATRRVGADDHGWVDPQAFRLVAEPRQCNRRGAHRAVVVRGPATAHRRSPGPGSTDAARDEPRPAPPRRCSTSPSSRLAGSGVPAHEVWLPPLNEPRRSICCCPGVRSAAPSATDGVPVAGDGVPAGAARLGGQALRPDHAAC